MIHGRNASLPPEAQALAPNMYTADAENMYTGLNQDVCQSSVTLHLEREFESHPDEVLAVSSRGTCTWQVVPLPADRFKRIQGVKHYFVDLTSVKQLLHLIIRHAYVTVGGHVFRQARVISVGINPAVYVANITCFEFELAFVTRLIALYRPPSITRQRRDVLCKVLRTFQWVVRYIDDIFAPPGLPFHFIEQFLYTTQSFQGVVGIYPPSIRIVSTSQPLGLTANYMDIHAYLAGTSHGPVMTMLYDKRTEPEFLARVQPIRLQHISTCLSASCKWNIFDAQFVRFTRLITDVNDFVDQLVSLLSELLDRGYPLSELLWRCRRRVLSSHVLFGVARGVPRSDSQGMRARGLYPLVRARLMQNMPNI